LTKLRNDLCSQTIVGCQGMDYGYTLALGGCNGEDNLADLVQGRKTWFPATIHHVCKHVVKTVPMYTTGTFRIKRGTKLMWYVKKNEGKREW
jgi:hypothetical protein